MMRTTKAILIFTPPPHLISQSEKNGNFGTSRIIEINTDSLFQVVDDQMILMIMMLMMMNISRATGSIEIGWTCASGHEGRQKGKS